LANLGQNAWPQSQTARRDRIALRIFVPFHTGNAERFEKQLIRLDEMSEAIRSDAAPG
jgi:hypothetical protein